MGFGDVLHLEAQEFDPVCRKYFLPVEAADAIYDTIRLATALGITVVEGGSNGGVDLDLYVSVSGKHVWHFIRSLALFTAWLHVVMDFLVSYRTPTVGTGRRSGLYLIYGILSSFTWFVEAFPIGKNPTTFTKRFCFVSGDMEIMPKVADDDSDADDDDI
jgi:hypothetical protein